MYEFVKKTLKEVGELMIKTSEGTMFELHIHNVSFDDQNKLIIIETGVEKYWIDGNQIAYVWIHRKKD